MFIARRFNKRCRTIVTCTTYVGLAIFFMFASPCTAAISVVPGGTLENFSNVPSGGEWSTREIQVGVPISTEEVLDVFVQQWRFQDFSLPVLASPVPVVPWATKPRYIFAGEHLRTYPADCLVVALMATLQNATGSNVSDLNISYDLGLTNADEPTLEQLPGHRLYYSVTGATNSWSPVGWFDAPGRISTDIRLGSWEPGSSLYLLWLDDNATALTNETDKAYSIDNVFFTPVPEPNSFAMIATVLAALIACRKRWKHTADGRARFGCRSSFVPAAPLLNSRAAYAGSFSSGESLDRN